MFLANLARLAEFKAYMLSAQATPADQHYIIRPHLFFLGCDPLLENLTVEEPSGWKVFRSRGWGYFCD